MVSAALENRLPFLGPAFQQAGLQDDEAATLLRLCGEVTEYSSYAALLDTNERLAAQYSGQAELVTLGYSTDYPAESESARRIEAFIAGRSKRWRQIGAVACLEAPEHATELAAPETADVLQRLDLMYPGVIGRMGYSHLAVSKTADPDGRELQRWAQKFRPTVPDFVDGGVRGDPNAQLAWSYPAPGYAGSSEARASLAMIAMFSPVFFGGLHGGLPHAYYVVSDNFPELERDKIDSLVQIYEMMGFSVDYDAPESGMFPMLSPGIMAAKPATPPKTLTRSGVVDYLSEPAVFFNPEVPLLHYPMVNAQPSDKTLGDALLYRSQVAARIVDSAAFVSEALDFNQPALQTSDSRRIHATAAHWRDMTPEFVIDTQMAIAKLAPEVAHKPLNVTEYKQATAPLIINAIMAVGNMRRLAIAGGRPDLAAQLKQAMTTELHQQVGLVHMQPLDVQVCAQALATLAGMRRVAKAKGL